MTKSELRTFISTLDVNISYCDFRINVSKKILPVVRPKEWYYQWYGVFKELKRLK